MPRFVQICPCVYLCMEGGAQRIDGSMCKGEYPCENAVCVGEEQAALRAGRTAWCEMDTGDRQGNVWGGAELQQCTEQESSRGGDESRQGKSSKGCVHEKLGNEECGKEWRRQHKDRTAPHLCCSPSLPCQFCKGSLSLLFSFSIPITGQLRLAMWKRATVQ